MECKIIRLKDFYCNKRDRTYFFGRIVSKHVPIDYLSLHDTYTLYTNILLYEIGIVLKSFLEKEPSKSSYGPLYYIGIRPSRYLGYDHAVY